MMRLAVVFVIVVIMPCFVMAESVNLSIILPDELSLGVTYTSLFKVTNLNHTKGVDSFRNITIFYNVTKDGVLYYESNFTKIVNYYTSSGTGYFFVGDLGNYYLCGFAEDSLPVCKNMSVINPLEIPCNVSVNISLDKLIYENKETVRIKNVVVGPEDLSFVLEYWVEDLFGNVAKNSVNTSNLNEKSFTPDISERAGIFFARNKLVFSGCDSNGSFPESYAMFVVKNQDYQTAGASEKSSSNGVLEDKPDTSSGRIASFYCRTKNYKEKINIYANIKADAQRTVLFKGKADEVWRKIYGSEKLVFEASAYPGDNYYELFLYDDDELVDSKSLIVSLKGGSAEPYKAQISPNLTMNEVEKPKGKAAIPIVKLEDNNSKKTINMAYQELNSTKLGKENTSGVEEKKDEISGFVAYESKNKKSTSYIPIIAILLFILAGIIIIFRRLR